jgi:hypothetical protein
MAPALLLILVIAVPAIAIILLRSDAAVVLLSLCAGDLLVKYVGSDTTQAVAQATHQNISGWAYVGLLLLPAVLSIVVLRKSVSSAKVPINLVTAIATGLVAVLLVTPLLPPHLNTQLTNNFLWNPLQQYQTGIISASIAIALVALWFSGHHHGGHKKH